jgi:hypothetical protein
LRSDCRSETELKLVRRAVTALLAGAFLGYLTAGARAQGPSTDALATSYVEAQEFGRRDESDPATQPYHRDVLLPEFGRRYRQHFSDCTQQTPGADSTPFSFVAAIGADGKVLRIWSDRSTNVYQCVRGRLLFDRFGPPPRAPFYLYIHMRFTQ